MPPAILLGISLTIIRRFSTFEQNSCNVIFLFSNVKSIFHYFTKSENLCSIQTPAKEVYEESAAWFDRAFFRL
jgi:hypothetical protein